MRCAAGDRLKSPEHSRLPTPSHGWAPLEMRYTVWLVLRLAVTVKERSENEDWLCNRLN